MADGTGLENRKGFALLVGSNPTPSALAWVEKGHSSNVVSVPRIFVVVFGRRRLARSMAPAC